MPKPCGAVAELGGEVARRGLVEIGDRDADPFRGQGPADRLADAPGRPGDDGALVRKARQACEERPPFS